MIENQIFLDCFRSADSAYSVRFEEFARKLCKLRMSIGK